MTPEGRVKAMVKAELKLLGKQCWKFMPVQTGMGTPALDFISCINGWFVAIETKKDAKAKLTDRQQATKLEMEEAGGIVLVVYDRPSLDRAMKIIRTITRIEASGYNRTIIREDVARLQAQDKGQGGEHLREQQQGKTAATTTRGDHGAPRQSPRRHAKPAAGRDDQPVTATVTVRDLERGGLNSTD